MAIIKKFITLILAASSLNAFAGYQLPEYEKITLDNGLTLYLMSQQEVPLIDISLVVKTNSLLGGNRF